jgi:nitrate reductase beta subunit
METRCMASCIGQIRLQGLVKIDEDGSWAEDRQNPLYYLIKVAKVALPLYPQFGTEPNGYYIPPRWVPRPYLRQMFGPGVDQAIDRYMVPDRELLAVLQLFRRSNRIVFKYEIEEGPKVYETELHGKPFSQYNDTVIAFGKDGQELFRTTVEEPVHVRPGIHQNSI